MYLCLEEPNIPGLQTFWIYDTAENGIGYLAEVTDTSGYNKSIRYDKMGRVDESTVTIDNKIYSTKTEYIGLTNHVDLITYPSGQATRNIYDDWGHHLSIMSIDATVYRPYKEATDEAVRLKELAEDMESETASQRDVLKVEYEAHMQKVQPIIDKIDGYWTMYENYIAMAKEASSNFAIYDQKVADAITTYNAHKENYDAEIASYDSNIYWYNRFVDDHEQYYATYEIYLPLGASWANYWAELANAAAKKAEKYATEANQAANAANALASKMNSAANTANGYANIRDSWLQKLNGYNAKIVELGGNWEAREKNNCLTTYNDAEGLCLIESGIYQTTNEALQNNSDYILAQEAMTEFNTLTSELNARYEAAETAIATANNLFETFEASPKKEHWRTEEITAGGQLARALYGNGLEGSWTYDDMDRPTHTAVVNKNTGGEDDTIQNYFFTFDLHGNLIERYDSVFDFAEQFSYDNLNRLKATELSGIGAGLYQQIGLNSASFEYDRLGNLTYKSDIGYYTYGGAEAGPHAVTSITGDFGDSTLYYDANGNLIEGRGRTIAYSTFNKPTLITKGTSRSVMMYGPSFELIKRTDSNGGLTESIYINSLYEEVLTNGALEQRHNLKVDGKTVAVLRTNDTTTLATHYLHRDHLESIVTITDDTGAVVDRRHYDAFGKERRGVVMPGTPQMVTPLLVGYTGYGFTGHKQLESVGLVHMGGRVYDPELGRFLSSDPFIQFALNSQSYNRYSYVLNNPLSFNDPSGYFLSFLKKVFKKIFREVTRIVKQVVKFVERYWKPIVAVIATVVSYGYASGWAAGLMGYSNATAATIGANATLTSAVVTGAVGGAAAGAASGLVMTGSIEGTLKGALTGAIAGAASGGVAKLFAVGGKLNSIGRMIVGKSGSLARTVTYGANTIMKATVGGFESLLRGQKFSRGFLSSGISAGIGDISRWIRKEMVAQSKLFRANRIGDSVGFENDGFKLAGGRYDPNFPPPFLQKPSPLGGLQGGPGEFFGYSYTKGSFQDYVFEAYAGPHDYLNNPIWYDAVGNIKLGMIKGNPLYYIGNVTNWVNVILATPLVVCSVTPEFVIDDIFVHKK
jgi:RHS repeat-associated protein